MYPGEVAIIVSYAQTAVRAVASVVVSPESSLLVEGSGVDVVVGIVVE